MSEDTTPVIVGVGRCRSRSEDVTPLELMVQSAKRAFADAGVESAKVDCVATVPCLYEMLMPGMTPHYRNMPRSAAEALGCHDAVTANKLFTVHTMRGGQSPHLLMSAICDMVAKGEVKSAVVLSSEATGCFKTRVRKYGEMPKGAEQVFDMTGSNITPQSQDKHMRWGDDPGGSPVELHPLHRHTTYTPDMVVHGLAPAPAVYSLFEQAYKRKYYADTTREDYQKKISDFLSEMSPATEDAVNREYAWHSCRRSAEEIGAVTGKNRMVYYPYTKSMNSFLDVNQGASIVIMSVSEAKRRGIPSSQYIYTHARCELTEVPEAPTTRRDLCDLSAVKCLRELLEGQLGKPLSACKYFDIYSCFPSAIRIVSRHLGIDSSSGAALTLTGGMPFYGGAGNSYVMHSICAAVEKVRQDPSSLCLVTGNGGYLSKHTAAVYSTAPCAWKMCDLKADQARVSGTANTVTIDKRPNGDGVLEVWTAEYRAGKPVRVMGVGTMNATGNRFVAQTTEKSLIAQIMGNDVFDLPVTVQSSRIRAEFKLREPNSAHL
ncbi:Acetyl-CoA acetyltransferase [Diplonema papillatum]|nr:Acetyl-CoA acetyltransferase [Diplonema papillatum]